MYNKREEQDINKNRNCWINQTIKIHWVSDKRNQQFLWTWEAALSGWLCVYL